MSEMEASKIIGVCSKCEEQVELLPSALCFRYRWPSPPDPPPLPYQEKTLEAGGQTRYFDLTGQEITIAEKRVLDVRYRAAIAAERNARVARYAQHVPTCVKARRLFYAALLSQMGSNTILQWELWDHIFSFLGTNDGVDKALLLMPRQKHFFGRLIPALASPRAPLSMRFHAETKTILPESNDDSSDSHPLDDEVLGFSRYADQTKLDVFTNEKGFANWALRKVQSDRESCCDALVAFATYIEEKQELVDQSPDHPKDNVTLNFSQHRDLTHLQVFETEQGFCRWATRTLQEGGSGSQLRNFVQYVQEKEKKLRRHRERASNKRKREAEEFLDAVKRRRQVYDEDAKVPAKDDSFHTSEETDSKASEEVDDSSEDTTEKKRAASPNGESSSAEDSEADGVERRDIAHPAAKAPSMDGSSQDTEEIDREGLELDISCRACAVAFSGCEECRDWECDECVADLDIPKRIQHYNESCDSQPRYSFQQLDVRKCIECQKRVCRGCADIYCGGEGCKVALCDSCRYDHKDGFKNTACHGCRFKRVNMELCRSCYPSSDATCTCGEPSIYSHFDATPRRPPTPPDDSGEDTRYSEDEYEDYYEEYYDYEDPPEYYDDEDFSHFWPF